MIRHFSLKMGLNGASQSETIQLLKSSGADVIQTSNGLCVKAEKSKEEVESLVGDGIDVEELRPESVDYDSLPKDVQAFLKG